MFDFNGDGKTTWDEEILGLALLEEELKKTNKNSDIGPIYKRNKSKARRIPTTIKAVPKNVDESSYYSLRSEYRAECLSAIFALVLLLMPVVLILWAIYSTYDPKNSASIFLAIIFSIAGLIYSAFVLHTIIKSITTSVENLIILKKRYKGTELSEKKSSKKWLLLLLLLIPLFIGSYILFSSDDSKSRNNDYELSTASYSQSKGGYNSSKNIKRINTEPAMSKEQAERLRGTGYNDTRPYSIAEDLELRAAQVKCKKCGMRSHNGLNSLCDACRYNETIGFDK